MANGALCCIWEVCCPPPPRLTAEETAAWNEKRYQELAKFIQKHGFGSFEEDPAASSKALSIAAAILAESDLVPAGVGTAIVEGYRKSFQLHCEHEQGQAGRVKPG